MSDEAKAGASRRDFLKLAGTAAPAAAALAVTTTGAEAAAPEGPQSGLADTAHTRAYFQSARF